MRYKVNKTNGELIPLETPMKGASGSIAGVGGLVPAPEAGDEDKVFQGNGTWGHKLQVDIVEQNGVYGYIDSGGNFVSFKSQADIDAAVAAAMVGTATAADVKEGVTFTNSLQSGLTGTFAAQEKTVTAGTSAASVTPDSGKYLSKVTYNPTPSQEKSTTASRSAQTITPDSGKLLSKVSIAKYPDATGTYTPTANSSASDMGKTNNYRYVDTRTVYNLGVSNGRSGYPSSSGWSTYKYFTAATSSISGLSTSYTYFLIVIISWTSSANKYKELSSAITFTSATHFSDARDIVSDAVSGYTGNIVVYSCFVKPTASTIKISLASGWGSKGLYTIRRCG